MAKKRKKPGPPTLCTPELIAVIAQHIKEGSSIEAACGAEDVDDSTLFQWRKKADAGIEPYVSILRPLKKALRYAVMLAEKRVHGGYATWTASARWLESMKPDPWRRTERRELAGAEGHPIEIDVHLGEELMRKVLAAAMKPGVPGLGG